MTGFHHIALNARDFDRTVAFYTQGLGFRKKISWGEEGHRSIMLDMGDGGCVEIFEGAADMVHGDVGKAAGNWLHLAIRTDDTRAMFERALAAGAAVSSEPAELVIASEPQPTPVTIAFVFGPDGELIEFFQER